MLANIYVFAVFMSTELGHSDEIVQEFGADFFGDLKASMLTLMNVALLAEWSEIIRPMMEHQPYLIPFLMIFAIVSTFGMINIMVGIIVDGTAEAHKEMDQR